MLRMLALSLVLATAAIFSAPARAEDVHSLPTPVVTAKAAEAALLLNVAPEVKAAWALQRRGRLMVAFGAGSLFSSALYLAWASQTGPCSDEAPGLQRSDAIASGILAGVGIGLGIGGGIAWGLGARRAERPATRVEKLRAALIAIGTAGLTQTALVIGRIGAAGFCAS